MTKRHQTRRLGKAEQGWSLPGIKTERARDRADALRQIEQLGQGDTQIEVLRYMATRLYETQQLQMETNRLLGSLIAVLGADSVGTDH